MPAKSRCFVAVALGLLFLWPMACSGPPAPAQGQPETDQAEEALGRMILSALLQATQPTRPTTRAASDAPKFLDQIDPVRYPPAGAPPATPVVIRTEQLIQVKRIPYRTRSEEQAP